ncbi:hypothetical protein FQN54_000170 [Arachnomyces sp. PD_36]|nr:hypothetical protein FQN54_000170 [Arachnomyces sp. PD_36]
MAKGSEIEGGKLRVDGDRAPSQSYTLRHLSSKAVSAKTETEPPGTGPILNNDQVEEDEPDKGEEVELADLGQQQPASAGNSATDGLTQEHRDYIRRKHGTLDLDPIPDMADNDPYNWPAWKVLHSSLHIQE